MVKTPSTMRALGTLAPDFSLPDTEGRHISLENFAEDDALLVIFMCNHCPFVKHIMSELVDFAKEVQARGVGVVAINSNDVDAYPDDAPDKMEETAVREGFTFHYLYDATQEVAKAYGAACTPDFFLYDSDRRLFYRGQFDDSRPGNGIPVTGSDLRTAVEAVLKGDAVLNVQEPSLGCNIKWKPGNEPEYFGGA